MDQIDTFIYGYFCWDLLRTYAGTPLREWRKSPYLLDAYLSRLTFVKTILTAFAEGFWPVVIWDLLRQRFELLKLPACWKWAPLTRLCIAMWYCLSIPVCSCGMPMGIYDTHFLAIKKMNSYDAEIREMYFQPQNVTFIVEALHCIWFAASVHFFVTHCGDLQQHREEYPRSIWNL